MSSKSKELQIVLDENKIFVPGDQIKGNIVVQSSKSIDVQHIHLCFKCYAEIQGDKKVLVEDVSFLAKPKIGKSSTSALASGEAHRFPFVFSISDNFPSTLKIPKMASISYTLTAIHKKPLFKLSSTLPTQTLELEVIRPIDVNSIDCRNQKKSNTEFGHIICSSETEWSTIIPRTGFLPGDSIPVQFDIRHFPPFKKSDAIKVSLLRLISKTEPFKTVEKKTLASKMIGLDTKKDPSQNITINLDVPLDTPPSLFPHNGQIMCIQYVIESELYLKNVKKAFIKAKKIYTHENVIIIGNIRKPDALSPEVNRKLTDSMYIPPSTFPVRKLEKKMSMMSTADSVRSSSRGSIILQSSGYETLKPLKRLDGEAPMKYTYNKRRSTKEEITKSNVALPIMLEETNKYAQSEPCLPKMIQEEEEEDIPSLPMLTNEHTNTNEVTKPFDPHAAPVHQDSFQSYYSYESRSPQTPGPTNYFNSSTRPPIHPLNTSPRLSLQYQEQITGTSIPHEYSPEELEAKQIPRMNTPDLSRNSTMSTVSTQSTADNQQKQLGRKLI